MIWILMVAAACATFYIVLRLGPLRGSFEKSKQIRRLTKILAPTDGDVNPRGYAERMAAKDCAETELVAYVLTNGFTQPICRIYGADQQDIGYIYKQLDRRSGFWAAGHWIPVSSLMFAAPLRYILENRTWIFDGHNIYTLNTELETWFNGKRGAIEASMNDTITRSVDQKYV